MKKRGIERKNFKSKKGISNLVGVIIIILMSIIITAAVFNILINQVKKSSSGIEPKIYAASNINIKILGIEFEGNNLKILIENTGQQDISSFAVRVTSSSNEIQTEENVYIAEKEKLKPLETKFVLIIPAPFGTNRKDYYKIEVFPKFEFNEKEEIAETAMASASGGSIGSEGGSGKENLPLTECSDGIDNDGDGLFDLDDSGCENSQDNNESGGGCRIDFTSIDGNLVQNPNLECDNDNNNLPDNWKKNSESVNHKMYWTEDITGHGSKIIFSDFSGTGNGDENSFGWTSEIPIIKPDTWYEFSFDYATNEVEPNINLSDNTFKSSTNWMGVAVLFYSSTIKTSSTLIRNADNYIWAYGPNLTGWDESAGVYRTYEKKGFENWRTVKKYIKTSSKTVYAEIKTYNYPRGKIYFDNFVLKEVGTNDPVTPEFKKSGTLDFIKFKEQDYFPIILYGIPKQGNSYISLDSVKENGFNSLSINQYYNNLGYSGVKQLLLEKELAAVVELPSFYYNNKASVWVNDPEKKLTYSGWNTMKSYIDNWAGFQNLLGFNGPDERDCSINSKGWYIPNLKSFELLKNYKDEEAPEAYLITNYCGKVLQEGPYTKNSQDLIDYYLRYDDILSQTLNTPQAYPYGNEYAYLNNIGKATRKMIDDSVKQGKKRNVLSFGLGVYWWSNWDGKGGWHFNQVIPFNLQRYQVWEQIINGATGVWFWGTYKIKTEDTVETQNIYGETVVMNNSYYNYHWKQITTISKELASLYPVLLEPVFYSEWQVSDSRIDIMMKKHAGKIYLFTASNHYEDISDVRISLPSYTIKKVTAINEVSNENLVQFNRTLAISSDKHSFTDDFIGDYDSSKKINAPGYAVHIYEIEY